MPPNGGVVDVTPANLIDARGPAGASRTIAGTDISDTVLGGARGERIDPRAGTVDRVDAGRGPDRVRGGPGEDGIDGGQGNDVLRGGSRHDYLTGGPGRDRLRDRGRGSLLGEAGNDRLSAEHLSGTLDGGAGDDVLIARGRLRRTGLAGGPGNDRYVLRGGGVPEIVELPRGGYDTIATSRKLTVPAGVQRAVATGSRRVRLRGGFGAQRLVGNRARNVLRGGPGADRLSGRGGNDTVILGDDAFD
ncbi:MAG: hypothetical protein ICV69_13790, partial [Thermoleophilaceae bacterium]|nr:hypothetical protein [Thermoleophilaceae bacterium]